MKYKKSLPPSSFIYTGDSDVETSIQYITYNRLDFKIKDKISEKEKLVLMI